jgi:hypothetical protein
MGRIDNLLANYRRHVSLPLRQNLPLAQRVWFAVYAPEDERRLADRVAEFELATKDAGLEWRSFDLTGIFADWMDTFEPDERQSALADRDVVKAYADPGFTNFICERLTAWVAEVRPEASPRTVFALTGLMELYDFIPVSDVIAALADAPGQPIPGVLLVFFPGERDGNTYRFLGARHGWNYLAVPILGDPA